MTDHDREMVAWLRDIAAKANALADRICGAAAETQPATSPLLRDCADFSVRARKCLQRALAIKNGDGHEFAASMTVLDVTKLSERDLLAARHAGPGVVREVRETLSRLGLCLAGEALDPARQGAG